MTLTLTRSPLLLFITALVATQAVSQKPPTALSEAEVVRRAVQNEVKSNDSGAHFMFREERTASDGTQTKLIIETRDAMAGMLIATNGRPLSPQQRETEQARLENLIKNPEELKKKAKREKEDADRTERIIKAFPDAFLYQADGTVPGEDGMGAPGDTLIRLKFRPNPKYSPPSHVEQILSGLQGSMLIDSKEYRIAKIDGHLFKEVGFGWGILGHLDPGGHFFVQQGDMGNRHWEVTRMDLFFTGKVMMFKSLTIKSKELYCDFRPAPRDLTFAQGVAILKKQEALLAENRGSEDERQKQ